MRFFNLETGGHTQDRVLCLDCLSADESTPLVTLLEDNSNWWVCERCGLDSDGEVKLSPEQCAKLWDES